MPGVILFLLLMIAVPSAGADEITLTTYYPAPVGRYQDLSAQNLQVERTNDAASAWDDAASAPVTITQEGSYSSGILVRSNTTFGSSNYSIGTDPGADHALKINRGDVPGANNDLVIQRTSGNVGIGLVPTAKFDVAGTIKTMGLRVVDGNQADGRVLTSDANGNVAWKDNVPKNAIVGLCSIDRDGSCSAAAPASCTITSLPKMIFGNSLKVKGSAACGCASGYTLQHIGSKDPVMIAGGCMGENGACWQDSISTIPVYSCMKD